MIARRRSARACGGLWLVAVAIRLGSPGIALAQDNKAQCVDAYEEGQRARKRSELLQAKESFLFCGSAACPGAMHADCQGWLKEVDAAIPKSRFEVTGKNGTPLGDVMVSIDMGEPRPLDGSSIELDPGAQVFVFTAPGYRELRERAMLPSGDRLVRRVALEPLRAAEPSPRPSAPSPKSDSRSAPARSSAWPAWLGAGIGAAGAVGFAYFGLNGRSQDRALDACSPACSVERADEVRRNYLLANVSLGVGAAGLIGAGAWLLFAPTETEAKPRAALEVQLGPVTWVRHRF
jgi:hypothetical protein